MSDSCSEDRSDFTFPKLVEPQSGKTPRIAEIGRFVKHEVREQAWFLAVPSRRKS